MEASLSSRGKQSVASEGKPETHEEEESGWTAYFEDFIANQREHSSNSETFINPSFVSDAASYVPWNVISNNNQELACPSMVASPPKNPKKLNFKKTRSKEIFYDDSLEDTASSPVNSPKVDSLKQMDMNQGGTCDNIESAMGKVGGYGDYSELQADERDVMNFEGKSNDSMDLKKSGLCLVPWSMLVNYLG
ncbi:unnamed protein product [Ilex paraguariensis]|uniref:Uncharacterized protein n=1 Tax=Ilex paraguariensis TaxID=185542 RepID=A0ABC8TN28_9AQUA